MFKKILLPVDGSLAAYRTAMAIASHFASVPDVKVTILLVTSPLETGETDWDEAYVRQRNIWMHKQAERVVAKVTELFISRGMAQEAKILEGDPVSTVIAHEARAGDYDLIAMGSRGMSMQKDNLHYVGSVTEHVLRRVGIPVLVIPAHEGEMD
ncbi:MAG TPA: universal stress protein [Chthonomonadaceae bacterium]|nr:universal stress protein [Chthonomonadaceae bacterium]